MIFGIVKSKKTICKKIQLYLLLKNDLTFYNLLFLNKSRLTKQFELDIISY